MSGLKLSAAMDSSVRQSVAAEAAMRSLAKPEDIVGNVRRQLKKLGGDRLAQSLSVSWLDHDLISVLVPTNETYVLNGTEGLGPAGSIVTSTQIIVDSFMNLQASSSRPKDEAEPATAPAPGQNSNDD